MNGIYAIYYTGSVSSGYALLLIKDGIVAGSDETGGIIDGTYQYDDDGNIDFSVTMLSPPNTTLVTGMTVGETPYSQNFSVKLPENLGNGRPVGIQTSTGPVNAVFRRLRGIP